MPIPAPAFAVVLAVKLCSVQNPGLCQTVVPDLPHERWVQGGAVLEKPPTLGECLGFLGQAKAREEAARRPGWRVAGYRCSITDDVARTRRELEDVQA